MNKALIVVDYSYDFIAADGQLTVGAPGQAIESAINLKIAEFMDQAGTIVFAVDYHQAFDPYHPETKLFPPHNIVGTPGRELFGRLKDTYAEIKDQKNVHWLDKVRYSAFYGTPLDALLRARGIDTVVIVGVCTDICVLHTAVDAYNLSYQIEIPKSAVASFNQAGHLAALDHFQFSLGAKITD